MFKTQRKCEVANMSTDITFEGLNSLVELTSPIFYICKLK